MPDYNGLLKQYDPQGMYDKIYNFPSQMKEGLDISTNADLPDIDVARVQNIVVCGLGGSAIGGDLVRTFLAYKIQQPFQVCRHYTLPEYVSKSSLCILSSYSGNTEETLSAYTEAKKRGAQVFAITSGGKLKEQALADGFGVVTIPPGYPPRAALGYSFVPMLVVLGRLGICQDYSPDIESTISVLEHTREECVVDKTDNIAIATAERLIGKTAIIYSGQDYFDAVAVRFKGQICENSKQLAFFNFFPEFNHNELVGWGIVEPYKDNLYTIMIRDEADHLRVGLRMDIVADIIREKGVEVLEFKTAGPNLLARMFSVIQFGDFVSLYIALLNKIDPTPVKVIDYLKGELEKIK